MRYQHIGVTPLHLLRMPDERLRETVPWDGTTTELRKRLRAMAGEGDTIPVETCDHHDEHGVCLGHDRPEAVSGRESTRPKKGER